MHTQPGGTTEHAAPHGSGGGIGSVFARHTPQQPLCARKIQSASVSQTPWPASDRPASGGHARAVHAHSPLKHEHVLHPSLQVVVDVQPGIGVQTLPPSPAPAAPDLPPAPPVPLPEAPPEASACSGPEKVLPPQPANATAAHRNRTLVQRMISSSEAQPFASGMP